MKKQYNMGTLIKYEWMKLFKKKIVWIAAAISFSFAIVGNILALFIYDVTTSTVVGTDGSTVKETDGMMGYEKVAKEKEYARALDGRVIDGELVAVSAEDERNNHYKIVTQYGEIYMIAYVALGEDYTKWPSDTDELYRMWRYNISAREFRSQYLSEDEIAYWEKKADMIKTPLTYRYAFAWQRLLEFATTNGAMLLVLNAICLAGVFSDEHMRRTDQLIMCTKNGKNPAYFAKMITGAMFGAGAAVILYTLTALYLFVLYGCDGFGAMFQQEIARYPYPISLGQAVAILFGLTVLSSVLESVFAMVLSERLKNPVGVMAVLVGAMLVTMLLSVPYSMRIVSQILSYIPTNLTTIWSFGDYRLVKIFGIKFNCLQFAALLYPVLTAVLVLRGRTGYGKYQVGGR